MFKKLALILLVLFAIETYGVYGAAMAKKVTHKCTLEVGPLCYAWEKNALGKILGDKPTAEIEDALEKAKKTWEDEVVDRASKAKDPGTSIEKALKNAAESVKDGLHDAKEKIEDLGK
jgi:hypothetical protein